ncbi:MAG TPA: MBL fold metallo-hydrolase [Thermoanaerobaculia bacterium]|nr:MBL fold metallo-hydrolase [Thermoanaerobaculia bacterium]
MSRRTRRVAVVAAVIVIAIVAVLLRSTEWLASLGGRVTGARLERARHSPQFSAGRFRNAEPRGMTSASTREMLRRQFFGEEQREPLGIVPVVRRTAQDYASPPRSGLRATWIGWSSVLIEIDGRRVLTDPVWSARCSPSTLVGPKRFHPPPIALEELPRIDAVVISHDHYDHLDMPTVRVLAARRTHFIVPLGIGAHLERWKIPPSLIHELDWNESITLNGLSFTSTRARHYSGRNPRHGNETLWSSWVVKGPNHRVFFSGDTGYSPAFTAIGEQHGPFDLTLIKIGASDPTWSEIHMTPEEAIQTHLDVRGRVMIPVHWATFNLAFHAWSDPVDRAVAAAAKGGASLYVPQPGEWVEPSALGAGGRWWGWGGR